MVGDELEAMFHELGVAMKESCSCQQLKQEMNALGPDGCEFKMDSLANEIRHNARTFGYWETTIAAIKFVSTYGLTINPLDPFPGLIAEAIRRTKIKAIPQENHLESAMETFA